MLPYKRVFVDQVESGFVRLKIRKINHVDLILEKHQVDLIWSFLSFSSFGLFTDKLIYFDGIIKLIYENGQAYNDGTHNRTSQIIFLCDVTVGRGYPTFVRESNFTYDFEWFVSLWVLWSSSNPSFITRYTSLVCPQEFFECSVTDPASHDHYDLHSLSRSSGNWFVAGERVGGDKV